LTREVQVLHNATRLAWLSTLVLFGCSDATEPTSPPPLDVAVLRSSVPAAALNPAAPKLIVSVPDAMGDVFGVTPFDIARMDLIFDRMPADRSMARSGSMSISTMSTRRTTSATPSMTST
jgi:hypothetical protein